MLETGRPIGLSSGLGITQSNSVDRSPTGHQQSNNAFMFGGCRFLVQISVVRMWSLLARLSKKMWFVAVRATTTTFFIDIGREKLAVFWINGPRREDSDKTLGVLGLCRL